MQNKNQKTESRRFAKNGKTEYKNRSWKIGNYFYNNNNNNLFNSNKIQPRKEEKHKKVDGGDVFLSLPSDQVVDCIFSDKLLVQSEAKVFESVMRWAKHDSASRDCFLPQLMEHVRVRLSEALPFHTLKSDMLNRYKPGYGDKVILVVGVFDERSKCTEFYDPKMRRWVNGPNMISKRWKPCLAVVKDNLVFAVGGSSDRLKPVRTVEVLDLSSEMPCWKPSVDMLVERHIFGVGVINNCLYAVGGHNYSDKELDTAEVFDYNTQEWRMISKMSTRRSDPGVAVLNNLLYAVGGNDESLRALNTGECYDPSLDTWTPIAKMSVRRSQFSVGVLDGILYAVGGHDNYNCLNSVEAYIPSTGVWITIADMHVARFRAGVVALDGLLYVTGGSYNMIVVDSTEYYSPETNTWTIVTDSTKFAHTSTGLIAINRPRYFKT
ncbi:ring canal kelch homolog [Acyrthosiphon pisum]|uniref:BACK domain-containing protein n=1 Tax=Acyrthosiphon pisum TaxID=7029 RepID=A0A8R2B8M2_ACYPI|nr:ring canal kelch homolog [Acyrthosiphon pisum]|eukprot:XP_008186422.2 PREDICTED: ring canal kelch homolog [Acyrthosiphon pisum]